MTLRQAYKQARAYHPDLSTVLWFGQGYREQHLTGTFIDQWEEADWKDLTESTKNKVIDRYDWWVEGNQFCIGTDLKPWPKPFQKI